MNKSETLDQLTESRRTFIHAIEGLSEAEITQSPVEGSWTIKDLLAHLAAWEKSCLIPLHSYAAGGVFVPEAIPDHLVWNEAQAQRWQGQTLAEIMAEYHDIRKEMVELITALPED